jgi:LysR family transcriptional regulator, transcription activator of glutamate synthase operon
VDLEQLRWFLTLAQTQHVTEAAARLGVSQPALSRALARLEDQVGTPLFDRVNRRLRLNAYGEILAEHARRSLAELDAAVERITALRDPDRGHVRLAFLHSLANWYVPEQLRRFRDIAPGVEFELFQGPANDIVARVAAGISDLGITSPRPAGDALGWRLLHVERLCLAVPPDHRFARRRRISLSAAAGEPFVGLQRPLGLRQLTDALFDDAGMHPDLVFEATEIPTMEGFVAAGFGVAVVPVPRDGDDADTRVVHVALTDAAAKREVGLVWGAATSLTPPAQRLAEFLR